jgi:hypothetical protein
MTQPAPPNWYVDPQNAAQLRYWDGRAWTGHTAPRAAASTESRPGVSPGPVPEPPSQRGGLFGAKKSLEAERDELRKFIEDMGFAQRDALARQAAEMGAELETALRNLEAARGELREVEARVVRTRDEEILQEVGVYNYRHRLEDSVAYKQRIDALRRRISEMNKKEGGAVVGSTQWQVNGSVAQGRKMVSDVSKLLLRAYNGEADDLVNRLKPYKVTAATDQLTKARASISKLGATMSIEITDAYHRVRIEELELTADYLARKEEEREAERAERERLRDEEKARREFEAERARLVKEKTHYVNALEKTRASGSPEEVSAAERKLAEVTGSLEGVEQRAANIRAGYVYVISNVGSFGAGVLKVGMTRRLDPMDRVRELGDASVPFLFDVHALVFADDAVTLESKLHQALAQRRVNLVNQRREFFYASPDEVRGLISRHGGTVLSFVAEPEASEWHQSQNARSAT